MGGSPHPPTPCGAPSFVIFSVSEKDTWLPTVQGFVARGWVLRSVLRDLWGKMLDSPPAMFTSV